MAIQIGLPGQGGMTRTAVGIDLGTTNSLIAIVKDNEPRVLLDPTGRALLPSAVAYTPEGVRVGVEALDVAIERPADTLISIKRLMGRSASDPEVQSTLFAHRLGKSDSGIIRLAVGDQEVTPVEVSAEILRKLKYNAEKSMRRRVTQAVITVPAYFDDAQRQATRDAGRLAGLEVLRLLNEPTAAALAYGLEKEREGTYAIYDLGGGTFDISILKLEAGVFEVLATGGNTHLGGDDFDDALANLMLEQAGYAETRLLEASTRRLFRKTARQLKEALTEASEASARVPLASGGHADVELTREVLEAVCRPILERTGAACVTALKDAALTSSRLNGVVLVGGATRMPMVRAYVQTLFGVEPFTGVDPDQVVALGAAVQAALLVGWKKDVLLLDVNPLSLGLETMGGIVEKLILRNSTIPASAGQVFTTYADGQTAMDIHVLQGERELAKDNRSLARFSLRGIPPLPAGVARVLVAFRIDTDGILRVTAREERTGVEQQVEIRPSYGLTDQEVEGMLKDALSHAHEDVGLRMLIDARVEAERILAAFELALRTDGDRLLRPEEATPMLEAAAHLRVLHDGEDHHAIREGIEQLDRASLPLAQRRMEFGIQQALAGHAVGALADELRERPTNTHHKEQLAKLDA